MRSVRLLAVFLVMSAPAAWAAGGLSPDQLLAQRLATQPIDKERLPSGFTQLWYRVFVTFRRPWRPYRSEPPPKASADTYIGIRTVRCSAGISYVIYPTPQAARDWLLGGSTTPTYSTWRLKQLINISLPHPRISGRIPGIADSVIVESSGHGRLYKSGITEMDALSGNVIVNVTTNSLTSRQHGDRVAARILLTNALAYLNTARRG